MQALFRSLGAGECGGFFFFNLFFLRHGSMMRKTTEIKANKMAAAILNVNGFTCTKSKLIQASHTCLLTKWQVLTGANLQ